MLKKIFVLVLLLFIFGCSTTVTNYEMDYYTNFCKDHGGIREANELYFPGYRSFAICQDGTMVNYKKE